MSDIISARCFGCGNIIKVPAGLGGKKARCPQCTNTITIPMPNDTQHDEIVPDTELPEVARTGEIVMPEEGDAPIPGQEPESAKEESDSRRRGGTSVRGARGQASGATHPRIAAQRSGTQPRYVAPGGGTGTRKKEAGGNNGMMIGIGLGVVALIIAAVVFAGKDSHGSKAGTKAAPKEKERDREGEKTKKGPQYTEAEQTLIARLLDYTGAVNRGGADQIMKFYEYEPDDERKIRRRVTEHLVDKKVTYENVQVKSVNTAGGTITFAYSGGEKTLAWKQVNDVWLIAEMPGP